MAASVRCSGTVCRVSSVLNRDIKQFGKQFLFDGREETCWHSDQGSSQWILLEFPQPVLVTQVSIQFQGGFSSKTCTLEGCQKEEELKRISEFYPEDSNTLQIFNFPAHTIHKLRISFQNSADFFGRIVIYHLDVLGQKQ
ncbi:nuclear receptor 2C2-associated protein [Bombina bombina]|uniref:nuclear receptor 2C2-associated protein n=1 Tax=Bombina bombina TaxID=8345 RepID=UPI00235B0E07|nr:nuclear receptor 2C2-associated protein [Bombina bombina]